MASSPAPPATSSTLAFKGVLSTALGTMFSRLLGFVREAFVAAIFGAGNATDLYIFGWRIANLMRQILAENATDHAFMPTFIRNYRQNRQTEAWTVASSVFNLLLLISSLVVVTAILTLPRWIGLIAPGFVTKGLVWETVTMTRIMFPYLVLISLAALVGSIQKSFNHFAVPAFAPIWFSLGLIGSVATLHQRLGLYSLGVGVLVGGFGHLLFQLLFFRQLVKNDPSAHYSGRLNLDNAQVRQVGGLCLPIFFDVLISRLGDLVDNFLASALVSGSLAALSWARTVFLLPFAVIIQSLNTVALKQISEGLARRQEDQVKGMIDFGINLILYLMLPITVLMILLRTEIIRVLFERGNFDRQDTQMTAFALLFYSLGLVGWGLHSFFTRLFAARLETRLSLYTNIFGLALNILLAVVLVATPLRHGGLALASSVAFSVNAALRFLVLQRRYRREGIELAIATLVPTLSKTILACLLLGAVTIGVRQALSGLFSEPHLVSTGLVLVGSAGAGLASFLLASRILRIAVFGELVRRLGTLRGIQTGQQSIS